MNVCIGVDSTWKMDRLLGIVKDLREKKLYAKRNDLFGENN